MNIRPGDYVVHETTGEVRLVIEVSLASSELTFSGTDKWTRAQGWKPTGMNVLPNPRCFGPYFSDHSTYMATKWAVHAGKASWIGYLHPKDPVSATVPRGPNPKPATQPDLGFRFGSFDENGCPVVAQHWPPAPLDPIPISAEEILKP